MPKLTFRTRSLKLDNGKPESVTVLSPRGFIDSASFRFFERALDTAFQKGTRFAVLDLSEVNYVNSTGISAIIRQFGLYRERDGLLVLTAVPKSVGLSMHLLGVTSLIPFHKDVEAAKDQFMQVLEGKFSLPEASEEVSRESTRRKVFVPLRSEKSPLTDASVVLLTPRPTRFSRILSLRYLHLHDQFKIFHDPVEALSYIEKDCPDLVVVDSRMDRNGDFVTKLKIHPERSLTSIIKVYPKESDELGDRLDFKIWENDYLVDPFEILELFSLAEAELLRVPKDRQVFQQQIRFEFRTTRQNMEKANKLADLIVRRCLSSEEDRTAMYAAVKEGLDNAAIHGNDWDDSKTIDVNFLVDRNKVTVIIEDEGQGFDFEYYLSQIDNQEAFEKARQRIMTEGRRGGLGILLMNRCSDRIDYSGAGNILRLEKNLK